MSKKGIPGMRFANHEIVEKKTFCTRCQQPFICMIAKNAHRKFCDGCLVIVTKHRKKIAAAKSNAKRRGKVRTDSISKPRLVRYAGYDPSERNR